MFSSSSATLRSTAIRWLVISAISLRSSSSAFSMPMRSISTARSRLTSSSSRAWRIRTSSICTARSRALMAISIWRCLFSSAIASSSSVLIRAASARARSCSRTCSVSEVSRACRVSISRRWRASASAWLRSSSSDASRADTFLRWISSSWSRSRRLVSTLWRAVISVIRLMPSESRMLFGSSEVFGVCSR